MVEVAFKVDTNSDFHKQYFLAKAEKQKFHDCAREFFAKHNLVDSGGYYQNPQLALQLTEEQKQRFAGQIKKYEDNNGVTWFKKNSAMQKEWNQDVVSKIDMKLIDAQELWWFCHVRCGSYALWDEGGIIYGYMMDKHEVNIQLADFMQPIKMSEYYAVIESRGK